MPWHRLSSATRCAFLSRWELQSLEPLPRPGRGAVLFVASLLPDASLTAVGFEQMKEALAQLVGMPVEVRSESSLLDSANPWRRGRFLHGRGGRADALEKASDIRRAARQLAGLSRGLSLTRLLQDEALQDRVMRWMQQLAVAVAGAADAFARAYPQVPWRAWAHLAQRLGSPGGEVDWAAIWATLHADVPYLLRIFDRPDPPARGSKRPATRSAASGTMGAV